MSAKTRALTIRLPETLYLQLQERAEADERTIAGLLRLAARHYLDRAATPPANVTVRARAGDAIHVPLGRPDLVTVRTRTEAHDG